MRTAKLLQALLLALLVISPRCGSQPTCADPPTALDTTPPEQGLLPRWAVGDLSLPASVGYVSNLHITEAGDVYQQIPQNDMGTGGCFRRLATARFVNDRVVITWDHGATQDLVHGQAGRVFLGQPSGAGRAMDTSCTWTQLVYGPLCQRDQGDCAGPDTIQVCSMSDALIQFGGDCPAPGAAPDGGVPDGGVPDGGAADGGVADGG